VEVVALTADSGLNALRAISEPTRLRIAMLLASGELTVKDFTQILGQSQPRISRHLKLMHDAALLSRVQEGSWVYFRLTDNPPQAGLLQALLDRFDPDDSDFRRDRERADEIRRERVAHAQEFFAAHADQWDRLRALHADEARVEALMGRLLSEGEGNLLVDLGTGTGRILELLARNYTRAIGIDTNQEMLAYARARMQGRTNAHVHIRQGDICNLSLDDGCADAVVMHQVLHYLPDPRRAIAEAARILHVAGVLLIVDFATHTVDRLRDEFAHQRLGFSSDQMIAWFRDAGLELDRYEELPPTTTTAPESLTVSFWKARHSTAILAADATNKILENTQ
jgi:ArsR family transcriptional regulator